MNRLKYLRFFLYIISLLSLTMLIGCSSSLNIGKDETADTPSELSDQMVINLKAYSKLYGYVRFFHPSDEAEELNWSEFVVYGTEKVLQAETEIELKEILENLFLPIAPSLIIYEDENTPDSDFEISDGRVVFWQHYGFEESGRFNSIYSSQRTSADISNDAIDLDDDRLFEDHPMIGETITEKISPTLSVSVPLMLNIDESGLTGPSNDAFENLKQTIQDVDDNTEYDYVRLSSIIVSWNVYNHFYPYFHVLEVVWEDELEPALHYAFEAETNDDYLDSLMGLLEKTEDGHTSYSDPRSSSIDNDLLLPFSLGFVEDSLVITASDPDTSFLPGDTLISIDDMDPIDWLEEKKEFIPGSMQWKTYYSLRYLLTLPADSITIERENQKITIDSIERSTRAVDEFYRPKYIEEVAEDIFYFNLNAPIKEELIDFFESNTTARGLIFDLRGYPADMYIDDILGRLTEETVSGPIGRIYNTVYPDRVDQTFEDISVPIEPIESSFDGKAVFLGYEGSISHPEFILTYVKNNSLGTIIGNPTAGSNGNISLYTIPPSIDYGTMTMLELLNDDESQTHLFGIEPDIYIERTLEGVKNEEDEFIDAAIEFILSQD